MGTKIWRGVDCPLRRNSAQKSCGHARDPFCIGIAPHTQTHPAPEIFARAQCATKQGTLARLCVKSLDYSLNVVIGVRMIVDERARMFGKLHKDATCSLDFSCSDAGARLVG